MKYVVFVVLFCSFTQKAVSQEKPLDLAEIGTYFTQDSLPIPCGAGGVRCFYELHPAQEKSNRPAWMGKQKKFYGILVRAKTTTRAYSDAVSLMRQVGVSLRNPVIEFKSPAKEDGMRLMLIIYEKRNISQRELKKPVCLWQTGFFLHSAMSLLIRIILRLSPVS